jgi:ornithine cyclodeaminase
VNLFDNLTGELTAIVDFHLVTKWKTAGDTLLSASRLARKDAT